jgi:hypothetical protein
VLLALARGVLTDEAFLDGAFPEWKFPTASSHPSDEETYRFFSPEDDSTGDDGNSW